MQTKKKSYGCREKKSAVDKTLPCFQLEPSWQAYVEQMKEIWREKGTPGRTTLFIGDSFFDEDRFWTNFYEDYYPGKDVLCFGIGSTTSWTWETLTDTFLADMQPKNIVMNIGSNNIYDAHDNAENTVRNIQRMFLSIHKKLPDAKIYYFSVTQRTYEDYAGQFQAIDEISAGMKKWCARKSWITFLDTRGLVSADMLRTDRMHPLLSTYKVFTDALESSGIEIESL